MFELMKKYNLEMHISYDEHQWTFAVSGLDAHGEHQTDEYSVQAEAEADALLHQHIAVNKFIETCRPKEV